MKKYIFLLVSISLIISCSSSNRTKNNVEQNTNVKEAPIVDPSFYQKKFLNGVDFFARGNEPFWTIEVDFENAMRFSTMEGIKLTTPAVEGTKARDADVMRYHAVTENGELIVTISKEDCQDDMSGEQFDYKVRVDAKSSVDNDYKTFEGCGKYLFDYRLNDIWVMESISSIDLTKAKLMKGLPTIEFNLNEMRFDGHAGCNNLMGKIEVAGSKIKFGSIASTKMTCPDIQVEQVVVDAINQKTFAYNIENMKLTLENELMKIVFRKVN